VFPTGGAPPPPPSSVSFPLIRHKRIEVQAKLRRRVAAAWLFPSPAPPVVPSGEVPGAGYWWWYGPGAVGAPQMLTILFPLLRAADEGETLGLP
jgi:hypothetical protein